MLGYCSRRWLAMVSSWLVGKVTQSMLCPFSRAFSGKTYWPECSCSGNLGTLWMIQMPVCSSNTMSPLVWPLLVLLRSLDAGTWSL
uniref:Putative secreted protein n=1 Tax=Ixodes ricinus TaxID=34613 RepID=A0A6B0U108_IXORI